MGDFETPQNNGNIMRKCTIITNFSFWERYSFQKENKNKNHSIYWYKFEFDLKIIHCLRWSCSDILSIFL